MTSTTHAGVTTPCPTCGTPLRWLAEHNSWGCDREQKMISPAQLAPQPPPPRAHTSSKKALVIGAVVAAAVASVIIAIVLVKGSGARPEGAKTPRELAERGIRATVTGDASEYLALAGKSTMRSIMDCKIPDDAAPPDMSSLLGDAMRKHKGVRLTIQSVDDPADPDGVGDPMAIEAGTSAGNSCVLKKKLTFKSYVVKMADGSDVPAVTMSTMQIGDRWFLSGFDELPTSKAWTKEDDEKLEATTDKIKEIRNAHYRKLAGGSPEAVARALVEAAMWRSRERAEAIAMRGEELETSLGCRGEPLRDQVSETRDWIDARTGGGGGERRREVVIKSVEVVDRGTAAGELRGCAIKTPTEWADFRVEVEIDGEPDYPLLGLAVKVEGAWRVLSLSRDTAG
jgi:hypothetical protein